MSIDGKVAVITGAARNLGRAYARLYGDEGARVVAADVDAEGVEATAKELRESGVDTVAVHVDVTDESSASALGRRAVDEYGTVDILVNNAAVWGDLQAAPVTEMDTDHWDLVMAVNVKGPLLCSRAVVPAMREQGWGRIINISSMATHTRSGAYGVSKRALNHLTWVLAGEVGDTGITVNGIAPGAIDNASTRRQTETEVMDRIVAASIVKRTGTAADIFAMMRYLVSDEAAWVTAQTFMVNGGYNVSL